jgi:multidrug efflux pump subunit AcrB
MVDVVTQSPGLSAEEIERYITIPIETQTAGLRNLTSIRTISLYGLSDVKLQFSFDLTYEQALQLVLNRLSQVPPLPNGAQPQISPVSPIGEIYRYRLVGPPGYSVLDLKTLQDWVLQRRFRAVPGVIDVTAWGGKTKTFELEVDFNKLIAYGLTLPQLLQALNNSNINVGGNTVNIGSQAAVVRGVGRRCRAGHRVDAPRRAKHADDQTSRTRGRAHQQFEPSAARRAHRAYLRSQRPDRDHDEHRPAQYGAWHRTDLHPAVGLSRQSAQRVDRCGHYTLRAVLRRRHHGAAR